MGAAVLSGSFGRGDQGCLRLLLPFRWLCLDLQLWGRVGNARHGDEVHRAGRICPALGVVLCPCLYVLVGVRRSWVKDERGARHRRLLLRLLRLRLHLCLGVCLS